MVTYLISDLRPGTAEVGREEEGLSLGCPSKRAVLRLCGTKPMCFPIQQRSVYVKRSYTYQVAKKRRYTHQVAKVCLAEVEARSGKAESLPQAVSSQTLKEYCPVPQTVHHAPSPRAKRNLGSP